MEEERIIDAELLLRGIPFTGESEPKYVDKGVLSSLIFSDRGHCPSVHMGKYANFALLSEEEPAWFCFAILAAGDIRVNELGDVRHDPNKHYSHALIVPPPDVLEKPTKFKKWRGRLTMQVWDLAFIDERCKGFRST